MKKLNSLLWTLIKYFLKYVIRIIQIAIFLAVASGALYLIYLSARAGYYMIRDIDLKGDLLVRGIPIFTYIILIGSGFIFLIAIRIFYLLCSAVLMLINGSLGDVIEYLNVTKKNNNYSGYLVLTKGGFGDILDADKHDRLYFWRRWWKRF